MLPNQIKFIFDKDRKEKNSDALMDSSVKWKMLAITCCCREFLSDISIPFAPVDIIRKWIEHSSNKYESLPREDGGLGIPGQKELRFEQKKDLLTYGDHITVKILHQWTMDELIELSQAFIKFTVEHTGSKEEWISCEFILPLEDCYKQK
jgi:hypothetical protein